MKINNWNQLLNYNNLIIFLNEHNIFVLLITCFFFNFFYFLIKLVSNIFNFIGKINKLIKIEYNLNYKILKVIKKIIK